MNLQKHHKEGGKTKKNGGDVNDFPWSSVGCSCADGHSDMRPESGAVRPLHGWIHRERESCRICQRQLTATVSSERCMNCDMTVEPEVTNHISDLGLDIKVSNTLIENVRSSVTLFCLRCQ